MTRSLIAVLAVPLFLLAFAAPALATAPPNDDFANAQVLPSTLPVSVTGNNISASKEPSEPEPAGNVGGASVWYSWVAPSSGKVVISTCSGATNFDTILGVYTGNTVATLTEAASNDDGANCPSNSSRVALVVTQGTTYRIAVDGYNGVTGSFTLRIDADLPLGDGLVWANYYENTLDFARLDASSGGQLDTTPGTTSAPQGVVIDLPHNKLWWLNYADSSISSASLSGGVGADLDTTGATFQQPNGLALDPATGTLYWANYGANTISYARTDGSGGGTFNAGAGTLNGPCGVAVDPAGGKLWWGNYGADKISYANLSGGGGGGDLNTTGATVTSPCAVALDRSRGKVYWSNYQTGIGSANISGGGGSDLNLTGSTALADYGIALDPPAGKIWWTDYNNSRIGSANLTGGGGADFEPPWPLIDGPTYPNILHKPAGTAAPAIGGGTKAGSELTCSQGGWAGDLVESFLYRAPQNFAYAWRRDGAPVAAASAATLKAEDGGQYTCSVTATNVAGSTTQTSAAKRVLASNKFSIGKPKLNKKKGTAALPVKVPGPGKLSLAGKGVKKATKAAKKKGTYKLKVKPNGKTLEKLEATGKAKVTVKVKFAPTDGEPAKKSAKVKLRKTG